MSQKNDRVRRSNCQSSLLQEEQAVTVKKESRTDASSKKRKEQATEVVYLNRV
jgi:hypothetical protein